MPLEIRSLGRAARLLWEPVPREKRWLLQTLWRDLDPVLRRPLQGFGRQTTGCGATLGILPKCDFDCLGCYLGAEANRVPRLSHEEALAQLAELRRWLGPKGNVQLTDGEVTLLPESELLDLVREARRLGLIPMVMSHGDTFRRRPELLARLVEEGGLTEVSIHVDSLQRGRRGGYDGRDEGALRPLRDELAALVRAVRRRTGRPLRAAMTATVARDNLDEVAAIVGWALANRDAFGLISFQPLAQVGRTREGLSGVTPGELWARIGDALAPFGHRPGRRAPLALGHPDCTRVEPMLVVERTGAAPRLLPIVRSGAAGDAELAARYLELGLGGLAFRDDSEVERICRAVGAFALAPGFWLGEVRAWIGERTAELGASPAGLALDLLLGRARLGTFQVVSHHFMGAAEAATPRGRERLAACVFRVPVEGALVPMCRVNAEGLRSEQYARQVAARAAARAPVPPVLARAATRGPAATGAPHAMPLSRKRTAAGSG